MLTWYVTISPSTTGWESFTSLDVSWGNHSSSQTYSLGSGWHFELKNLLFFPIYTLSLQNYSILSEISYLFLHMLLSKCSRLLIGTMSFLLKSIKCQAHRFSVEPGTRGRVLFYIWPASSRAHYLPIIWTVFIGEWQSLLSSSKSGKDFVVKVKFKNL